MGSAWVGGRGRIKDKAELGNTKLPPTEILLLSNFSIRDNMIIKKFVKAKYARGKVKFLVWDGRGLRKTSRGVQHLKWPLKDNSAFDMRHGQEWSGDEVQKGPYGQRHRDGEVFLGMWRKGKLVWYIPVRPYVSYEVKL